MRNPDSIPRYEIPDYVYEAGVEPATGSCWNCGHKCEVFIEGLYRDLCASERDDGSYGELTEAPADMFDCSRWVSYE